MRVLVTGAFGNVGQSAIRSLCESGYEVRAFDLRTRENERRASKLASQHSVDVVWGDMRDADAVAHVARDCAVVVHLAFVIPPLTDLDPVRSEQVNVGGTKNLLAAALAATRPRILFISTFDVFGRTQDQPPPRRVGDPVIATNPYTAQKIACEDLVKESGLDWLIFRFADVPVIGFRSPHPIMFEIPLSNRFEVLHTKDAGRAIAAAVSCDEAWGNTLLIGGGPQCQITYRDFLFGMLDVIGVGALPEAAFTTVQWPADWIDTTESQRLLQYQQHDFDAIMREVRDLVGVRRLGIRAVRPIARRVILSKSPYLKQRAGNLA